MTEVDFHTGVADPLAYSCRLLRKAWRSGRQVVVSGAAETLSRLDALLWTFDPGEFIPHARLRAGEAVAPLLRRTPIWLADRPADAGLGDVLLNLGPDPAQDATAFARLIEVVGDSADEVDSGRLRWRHARSLGLAPRNHPQAGERPAGAD